MHEPIQRLDRAYIGKTYQLSPIHLTSEKIHEYALASNEKNLHFLQTTDESQLYVPPLLPIILVIDLMKKTAKDCRKIGINPLKVVEGEYEVQWMDTMQVGDFIESFAEVLKMKEFSGMDIIEVLVSCLRHNDPLLKIRYSLVHFTKPRRKSKKLSNFHPQPKLGKKLAERSIIITQDQAIRYGEVSGDRLPIHFDEKFAHSLGFPGPILHGPCVLTMALQAVVDDILDGDPTRLDFMKVRVKNPVLMGQTITTQIYETQVMKEGYKVIHFITINQEGIKILSNGVVIFKE
ncbi:MAG: MaoC/PaaZ C-terminal domain-containing protein [Promethearchaeota archaeon]